MDAKRLFHVIVGVVFIVWVPVGAQTTVEEHWSPYDYPRQIEAGIKSHVIVKGDTLWDIAQQYFNNPTLWPQIYQANPYIKDPDLIYPGDPLVLEIGVVVTDQSIADSLGQPTAGEPGEGQPGEGDELAELAEFSEFDEEAGEEGVQVSDRAQTTSLMGSGTELVIIPAGDRSDIECSTYLYPVDSRKYTLPFSMYIVGGENPTKQSFAVDDVVYVNKGAEDGLAAGDIFGIRREIGLVKNPENNKDIVGVAIDQIGRLRIIAVQDTGSTAVIIDSCDAALRGDLLVPFEQEPIPLITEMPPFDRWSEFNKEGSGYIVCSEDQIEALGRGNLVNIDKGILDNIAPGDIFIVYRNNPNNNPKKGLLLPDIYLGQGVALRSNESTSVMKIIESVDVIKIGDRVVPFEQ